MPDKPKGGSNAGKYKTKGPFCGPSGGAPKGTYPVNSRKRAVSALAYARNAPNPSGIRKCVCRHWSSLPACSKDATGEWGIDTIAAIDEFKVIYTHGMLTMDQILVSLIELMAIEQCSEKDQASIVCYIVGEEDVVKALDALRAIVAKRQET